MQLLVEDGQRPVCRSVSDVVVGGQRHTFNGVLEVRLRDGAVVDEDGATAAALHDRPVINQLPGGKGGGA